MGRPQSRLAGQGGSSATTPSLAVTHHPLVCRGSAGGGSPALWAEGESRFLPAKVSGSQADLAVNLGSAASSPDPQKVL